MTERPTMSEANPLSRVIGMTHEEAESLKRIERLAWEAHAASGGDDPYSDGDPAARRDAMRKLRAALHGMLATIKVHYDLANRLESCADREVRKAALAERDALTVAHGAGATIIDHQTTAPVDPTLSE